MMASAASHAEQSTRPKSTRVFLCGDVMTGRGVDQILPHPSDPLLHENNVESALDYVRLAEDANGPIPRPQQFSYPWGVALDEWSRAQPDVRIINLETSITRSNAYEPKGINYRMSPGNVGCLSAAGIDCCALANNHVLDWGQGGLLDTLENLDRLRIKRAGAGRDDVEASAPAIVETAEHRRVVVFAFASTTSGVPRRWAATAERPGVNLLGDLSEATASRVVDAIERVRRPGDIVVISIHWGPNWGYDVPSDQRRLARELVERADVSIVHGHSSHHAKTIEVYRNRLILYGCGDFLNDYEGIGGYETFRADLPLMYFADLDFVTGELAALEIIPLQTRRLQLVHASRADAEWLAHKLDEVSRGHGTHIGIDERGRFKVSWW